MSEKRALFIIPPTGLYLRDRCYALPLKSTMVQNMRPPMDLAYMAAMLERIGCICEIHDYPVERTGWNEVKKDICRFAPHAIVVSTTPSTIFQDMEACGIAKEKDLSVITIAKGGNLYAEDMKVLEKFKHLDIVIRNEPEIAIEEIMSGKDFRNIKGISYKIDGNCFRNEERSFLLDLNTLPFPARHLLNNKLYKRPDTDKPIGVILTGKGCRSECIFCPTKLFSGNVARMRSPENILEEIDICVNKFGIKDFLFQSDNFSQDKDWAIELCRLIAGKGLKVNWGCTSRVNMIDREILHWLKKAGCWVISLGIESGNRELLLKSRKGISLEQARGAVKLCKEADIKTFLYFMIGLPWETKATVRETIDFAKELDADFYEVHTAYPFPGTEFYKIAMDAELTRENLLTAGDYGRSAVSSLYLTRKELSFYRRRALLEIYLRPRYIKRILKNIRSFKEFVNYLNFGFKKIAALF